MKLTQVREDWWLTDRAPVLHHERMANDKRHDAPLTWGDFEDFSVSIKQEFNGVHARMDRLEQMQEKTLRIQEATLATVQSVDAQLKERRDLPHRVEKLESDVFQLKTRR